MATRFCTSCQCARDADTGITRKVNKTSRWICRACLDHKTESLYKSKTGRAANVPLIMAKLYAKAQS